MRWINFEIFIVLPNIKLLFELTHNFTFLSFTDPPEIVVESPTVFSGEGLEAMLVCIVHGEAAPDVSQNIYSYHFLHVYHTMAGMQVQIPEDKKWYIGHHRPTPQTHTTHTHNILGILHPSTTYPTHTYHY